MSRPSFTTPEPGMISFTIPAEWYVIASAVSCQSHQQNLYFDGDTRKFQISNLGTGQGMMFETHTTQSSSTITLFEDGPTPLTVYCSNTTSTRAQTFSQLTSKDNRAYNAAVSEVRSSGGVSDNIPEYINYFIFVQDSPKSTQQFDMLVMISMQSSNKNEIPPPPPPNTNPGYNPVLDLPWPQNLENYLRQYDTQFVLDDSPSMKDENRWVEAGNALTGLSQTIFDNGWEPSGFSISFLNSTLKMKGITDRQSVATILRQVSPDDAQNGTPTGQIVGGIFNAHIDKLDQLVGKPGYATVLPLNIVCITDGAANDKLPENELGGVLERVGARLAEAHHHPNSLGVQFVQVGSDADAAAMLQKLLQLDTGGIVDTVPWEGPGSLSPDKLKRILLGGVQPNIRAIKTHIIREAQILAHKKRSKVGSPIESGMLAQIEGMFTADEAVLVEKAD